MLLNLEYGIEIVLLCGSEDTETRRRGIEQ
jgi:hypothetical protein